MYRKFREVYRYVVFEICERTDRDTHTLRQITFIAILRTPSGCKITNHILRYNITFYLPKEDM